MNLTLIFASFLALIALGAYSIFAFIIIFHIKKYGMDKGINRRTLLVFGAGLIAISFMMVEKFAAIDWDQADTSDLWTDSDINFFHIDYDRR
jgi:hypothetical protein